MWFQHCYCSAQPFPATGFKLNVISWVPIINVAVVEGSSVPVGIPVRAYLYTSTQMHKSKCANFNVKKLNPRTKDTFCQPGIDYISWLGSSGHLIHGKALAS